MANDQTPKRESELYKVESIDTKNGECIPGTEEILYEGNNRILALAELDMFEPYGGSRTKRAIVSQYIPEEDCWKIIEEK